MLVVATAAAGKPRDDAGRRSEGYASQVCSQIGKHVIQQSAELRQMITYLEHATARRKIFVGRQGLRWITVGLLAHRRRLCRPRETGTSWLICIVASIHAACWHGSVSDSLALTDVSRQR